jgi:hypothetical protein
MSGVIQCFSVKKGEVVISFRSLPGPQKVKLTEFCYSSPSDALRTILCTFFIRLAALLRSDCAVPPTALQLCRCASSSRRHSQARPQGTTPCTSHTCIMGNPVSTGGVLLLCVSLQVTAMVLGRSAKLRDKIFVAAGNTVSGSLQCWLGTA